jgi:predicted  nucleic acid-binding Zn ribbon protein
MMDGKPDRQIEKSNLIDENELVKEPWMIHKKEEEFNSDEKRKWNEYLQKERDLAEKKEKIKSQAITRYNNCKSEIEGAKDELSSKIQKIIKLRLYYDYKIIEQEIYILSIARTLNSRKNIKSQY